MTISRTAVVLSAVLLLSAAVSVCAQNLNPRGKIHVPIGLADANDRLKTIVEAEGNFSPGVGSYGVYFWATDPTTGKLVTPTTEGVAVEHGLAPGGLLIPWASWSAGPVRVRTEVCHTLQKSPRGDVHVAAARATLTNTSPAEVTTEFTVAVRDVGPAGFVIKEAAAGDDHIRVDGRPAVVVPAGKASRSLSPDRARPYAALVYVLAIPPNQTVRLSFVCPVLPGRRVLPHWWDGKSTWAQFDLAPYNPPDGGLLQPDPGVEYYGSLNVDDLFAQAAAYYRDLAGRARVRLPDARWSDALVAMTAHAALAMNDGAPDVTVVNYNVFNRDGIYVTNILQKAGRFDLAARCIDHFLAHPFNGRVQPEADNPGQILWAVGEHWRFTRDAEWLRRVYPGVRKLAAMIGYYRTTPEPHWVWDTSLDFGEALPADQRKRLKPGACDGFHPEYTEAWDVSGLRAAAECARALDRADDAASFSALADDLMQKYDARFGSGLPKEYGSYSVLWPCRLYPYGDGKAYEQFKSVGAQQPTSWRYFPLAKSHQGLLAGNRDAGWRTINIHLDHAQMTAGQTWRDGEPARGFFAFDEGGKSGAGGWKTPDGKPLLKTTWDGDVAMPHGWAIAELHLLIRDALVYEDGDRLVLLAGVPPEWFAKGIGVENLPTHFGPLTFKLTPSPAGATLSFSGARPPAGLVVRTPAGDVQVGADRPAVTLPPVR